MPILALSQPYHTRRDIPYPGGSSTQLTLMRSVHWLLKAALKGEISTGTSGPNARVASTLWTHVASSDGSSRSDVTDLWGATYTAAALVWANDGTSHSWIHLRNAALGVDLVIDLAQSSTTNIVVAMVPTTRGFSAGTVASRPVNLAFEVNGGYTSASLGNWLTWQQDTTTGGTNFAHFTVGDDGSFYFTATRQTGGCGHCLFAIQKPQSVASWPANVSDVNNVQLIFTGGGPSAPGAFAASTMIGSTGNCMALMPNDTRTITGGVLNNPSFQAGTFANSSMQTDAYGLEFSVLPLPILQWNNTSVQSVVRGVIRDWWLHPNRTSIPTGQVNDPAAVINHVVFGDYFMPWNGATGPTF